MLAYTCRRETDGGAGKEVSMQATDLDACLLAWRCGRSREAQAESRAQMSRACQAGASAPVATHWSE